MHYVESSLKSNWEQIFYPKLDKLPPVTYLLKYYVTFFQIACKPTNLFRQTQTINIFENFLVLFNSHSSSNFSVSLTPS